MWPGPWQRYRQQNSVTTVGYMPEIDVGAACSSLTPVGREQHDNRQPDDQVARNQRRLGYGEAIQITGLGFSLVTVLGAKKMAGQRHDTSHTSIPISATEGYLGVHLKQKETLPRLMKS
jgi:hypothetical protein